MTALEADLNFYLVITFASILWVILAISENIGGFGVQELTVISN